MQKGRSKKTRRKKSKALPGMVQNFQANNVSGHRLTLKPRELGLFNKGRTSTAVKGRGLPDLVFSEMKFLQKEKVQPEANREPEVAKKKRKKDHAQTKEGEISAFFNATRPELTESDENTRPEHAAILDDKRRAYNQHPPINTTIPTVELTDKASYLGFESRRPRHGSTSYVSWSESIHAPSTTPARLPIEADTIHGQRDSDLRGRYKRKTDREKDQSKRPAPPTARKQADDHIAERFRVPSLVPSHNRTSRSHSYPQHSSSPRRMNLVDRSARFESTDTACSPLSMPPSMPHASMDVRPTRPGRSPRDARQGVAANTDAYSPAESQNRSYSDYGNDDGELQTSSDLERVLQQCNEIFHERRQAATPRRRHTEQIEPSHSRHSTRRQNMRDSHAPNRRVHTVRFADPPYQERTLPNSTGPSIYEQQTQYRQSPPHSYMEEDMYQSSYPMEHGYPDNNERTCEPNWEGLSEEAISYGLEESFEILDGEEEFTASIGRGHPSDLRAENDVVAPGFWRPNKLY
ncbi:hypothetical protein PTTW11_09044 [Pyrenophora teres f. teres]|nr:hypothetical protein PTTW11_09044 [Pyrenophora teres f. teres]